MIHKLLIDRRKWDKFSIGAHVNGAPLGIEKGRYSVIDRAICPGDNKLMVLTLVPTHLL